MASDYGFYGSDGYFSCEALPIQQYCSCLGTPILHCQYDDTVGFKETVYQIQCDTCKRKTRDTCVIENVIAEWNSKSSP